MNPSLKTLREIRSVFFGDLDPRQRAALLSWLGFSGTFGLVRALTYSIKSGKGPFHNLSLGGEQSGHVIFTDAATTGDGLLTALNVMARMASSQLPLAELAAVVQRLPQVLVNVQVTDRARACEADPVKTALAQASAELGDRGRILLRPSGTEPLVRVMVEAGTHEHADEIARRLADVVARSGQTTA